MTLEKFAAILESIGFPVAYNEFPEDESCSLPFICYITDGEESFYADGVAYAKFINVVVELYCERKSLLKEKKVEGVFERNKINYAKEEQWIEQEKVHLTIYNIKL